MAKYKKLIIASVIFFLLVNTVYYWEGTLGIFAMLTFLLMVLYFIVLAVLLYVQIFRAITEKLRDKPRLYLIGLMTGVLALAFFFPNGIVDFEKMESDAVLIAQREGVANCMITLKLRKDYTFKSREVCFGVDEITGTYRIKGDTVFFERNPLRRRGNFYEFAIIERRKSKSEKHLGTLVTFKNSSDTTGMRLGIVKMNLANNKE